MIGLPIDRWGDEDQLVARIKAADLYVMARTCHPNYLELVHQIHSKGKKVALDWDDDVFRVSPLSDHYHKWGTEAFSACGLDVWIPGKNLDVERNKQNLDTVKRICEAVDMITVTTERLGLVYREFNENIRVLPNCVDLELWERLPLLRQKPEIRMGWFGGSSHYEDWLELSPILPDLFSKYPNLKLVIMGQAFKGTLKGIPEDRLEIHGWTNFHAYPYRAAKLDLDFAVIPLKESDFNAGKSPIKWIEMGALKVPAVTSLVPPYDLVAEMVPDNGIFVENRTDAWMVGISTMVDHPELRSKMGESAYLTVAQNFDINTQSALWSATYKEALTWQPRQRQPLTIS